MRENWVAIVAAVLVGLALVLSPGTAIAKAVKAGPIWNDADALKKCPHVCAKSGRTWNGVWRTTKPGEMSICKCVNDGTDATKAIGNEFEAGPIWNNADAQAKCPRVCNKQGSQWDGSWRTTKWGKMSVCGCGNGGGHANMGSWRPPPPAGPTTSCSVPQNGGCASCAVSCPPGKQASCTGSETVSYDARVCWTGADCRCQ